MKVAAKHVWLRVLSQWGRRGNEGARRRSSSERATLQCVVCGRVAVGLKPGGWKHMRLKIANVDLLSLKRTHSNPNPIQQQLLNNSGST
jgi:hypothetical protein